MGDTLTSRGALAGDRPSASAPLALTAESIVARIDRLPSSPWHRNIRIVLGMATFFDAFDAVAIAFVLPVLAPLWHLQFADIALLISAGFAGQLLGALAFGSMAERFGRIRVLNWTILILSVFGLACAFAWSYWALVVLRFLQGLGLGGELPVAATFVSEISQTKRRGLSVMQYQLVAPIGFLAASLGSLWIVPHLGWQWMFIVGAVPALLTIAMRRLVPESPRWLARQGRLVDADTVLSRIEATVERQTGQVLPVVTAASTTPIQVPAAAARWADLFRGIYRGRTFSVWLLWFCQALISYGLLGWLPTIFRSIYKMSVSDALLYSSLGNVLVVLSAVTSALVIDRVGRRTVFIVSFTGSAIPLLVLWSLGGAVSAKSVMILSAIATAMIAASQLGIWAYTPEIYPTRMRSLGAGAASSWARFGSIVAPLMVGYVLTVSDISGIFLTFGLAAVIGAATVMLFLVETRNRLLEEISP